MKLMMIMIIVISSLIMVMTTILNLTSTKTTMDREKSSPFECGFDPKSSARLPFSLQFFMVALIFLIFDIEISLMFPMTISMTSSNMITYVIMMISIIMILTIGLIHEWYQGALEWKN